MPDTVPSTDPGPDVGPDDDAVRCRRRPPAGAFGRWRRVAADLIFPPTCILCGAPGDDGHDLCAGCAAELPVLGRACVRCALPLPVVAGHGDAHAHDDDGPLCGDCRRKPPAFTRAHAAFRYEPPLPTLVAGFKFNGRLNTLRLMGELLATSLHDAAVTRPACIIPVPLHMQRLRERGYDQALELARVVGRALDLPVVAACERTRATPPQTALERQARQHNLLGAFRAAADLTGAHVAVLDDVITTASTVGEVARTLRRAGARRVDIWCLARTP
ncbi:ComF family protein [uncultured Thiohalocapsa sp.]|uniref:ComF family protein n=1 Tax=uncultured Thiohalocapsa sp. TaxID=768990 RepID=UPI0025DA58BD|nr:ComF family protein [uncultured Thiohalocapsa sp.]